MPQKTLTIFFILISLTSFGQAIKEMKPKLGKLINKSQEEEIEFLKLQSQCEAFWLAHQGNINEENFTDIERELYEKCQTEEDDYWSILGPGCSWYCGGGLDTNSASSTLKDFQGISYSAKNIHDLSYKTTWIEGVPGYGIGESVTYYFPPENPRITSIIIVNGYVKSKASWQDNSRVKKLKMYLNNKPYAILNLADSRQEQTFNFKPLGYGDRRNWEKLAAKPKWTIKFEILEVYKGDKYDDTAITEIYFDGIDVH